MKDILIKDYQYEINQELQGDPKDGEYTKLFNVEDIQDVKIIISESNWKYLLENALEKPTVLTTSVTIGEHEIKYAGIKTKGNLTLTSVWEEGSQRFSFTLNFGKYINKDNGYSKKQNFYGLSKVALNNMYGDVTLMKEYLSYELLTQMGVETPKYCLVNLYINNEFYGVYMMVESIDSALTERTIGEKSDFLVKPERFGSDLVYDTELDKYINENGEFDFTSILYDENNKIIYPKTKENPLYKYNGLWENDEETFEDIVEMLPIVFKWIKTLNELNNINNPNTPEYVATLEKIIPNIDNLIKYFAANTYLVNLDSYISEKMHNYGLYLNKDGQATIFPWDYNLSFGAHGSFNALRMINYDIYNPAYDVELRERPLLNVIFRNDDYKKKYETYIKDACIIASKGGITSLNTTYSENNFENILEKYRVKLVEIYSKDSTAFYTVTEYEETTKILKEIIKLRTQAVLQQLEGNKEIVKQINDNRLLWQN